jgi:putative ABC transport system substrate-binding protein
MRRREFIGLLGGGAAWPLAARAQQPERVRRIAVLTAFAESDADLQSRWGLFEQRLQQLGWTNERNIRIDYRWAAGDADHARKFARELVESNLDVILGHGTAPVTALQQETATIPIVFVQVTDPVRAGFVKSLANPGGNITGFAMYEPDMGAKWLQVLKEIAPAVTQVAIQPSDGPRSRAVFLAFP